MSHKVQHSKEQTPVSDSVQNKRAAPVQSPLSVFQSQGNQEIQAALKSSHRMGRFNLSAPDDPLEQQAKRSAKDVLESTNPTSHSATYQRDSGFNTALSTKRLSPRHKSAPGPIQSELGLNSGRSMEPHTLSFFEQRFGADFSDIRIHVNAHTDKVTRVLGASALVSGNDISFRADSYRPESNKGKLLLAHELAHTLQDGRDPATVYRDMPEDLTSSTITTQMAEGYTSDQRQEYILWLREQMRFFTPSSIEYAGASGNLQTLESVERQQTGHVPESSGVLTCDMERTNTEPACFPGADVPIERGQESEEEEETPPEPGRHPLQVSVSGIGLVQLSDSEAHLRYQMRQIAKVHGRKKMNQVHGRLTFELDQMERPRSSRYDAPWVHPGQRRQLSPQDAFRLQKGREIARMLSSVVDRLNREFNVYLDSFERTAEHVLRNLLTDSERRLTEEALKVGLSERAISGSFAGNPGEPTITLRTRTEYGMERTSYAAGLIEAARQLSTKRDQLTAKQRQYNMIMFSQRVLDTSSYLPLPIINPTLSLLQRSLTPTVITPRLARLQREIAQLELEYERLSATFQIQYPILAALQDDPDAVANMARQGVSEESAMLIGEELAKRRQNIAKVRQGLASRDVKVWKLPRVMVLTKSALNVRQRSLHDRIIDDKIEAVKDREFWRNIALGAIALALGLLAAIPTGGSSLVAAISAVAALGSLTINVAMAAESLHRYELERALAGTDMDRARAISQDDPSLFWLALELIGAGLEVGPAVRAGLQLRQQIFRNLAPLARRATATREAVERSRALGTLEEAASAATHSSRTGQRIRQAAERVSEASQRVSRAARTAAEELGTSGFRTISLPRTAGLAGPIRLSPNGWITVCGSPCMKLSAKYATQLSHSDELARQVAGLEEEAGTVAGRIRALESADDVVPAALREQAEALTRRAAELERQIRMVNIGWDSPLRRIMHPDEYQTILRRRGTAAPTLDTHPSNWTGPLEAVFRGYPDPDPIDAYQWILRSDGQLELRRALTHTPDGSPVPRIAYDETAQRFVNIDENLTRAAYRSGARRTRDIPSARRAKFDDLLQQRENARLRRAQLESEMQSSPALSSARREINEASRQLGEEAADAFVRSEFPNARRVYPRSGAPSRAGDFDLVYEVRNADGSNTFLVVEAKGGSSSLGYRQVGTRRVQQGTAEYFDDIASVMRTRSTEVLDSESGRTVSDLANDIISARQSGADVRYLEVRMPISTSDEGLATLDSIQINRFDI